jgi:putative Ca2+/H+ antiporter (TMEM165/GDT1 family)
VETFLVSTLVVGLAEIGDKTQLLSLMLAARFQRPLPIIFGILFATIANHAVAGLAGTFFGALLSGPWLRWILAASFLSFAVWALFPDRLEEGAGATGSFGAFMTSLCSFFSPRSGTRRRSPRSGLLRVSRNSTRS